MPSLVSHQLSIIKYVVLKKIFFFLCFDRLIWTWTWTWTRTSLDSNLFGLGLDLDSNLFGLGLVLDSTKVDLTTALTHTHTWAVGTHTHTPGAVETHTHTHTPGAVGSQRCGVRGAVGGSVPCSRVSLQSWTIPAGAENPQPQITSPALYPLGHDCTSIITYSYTVLLHIQCGSVKSNAILIKIHKHTQLHLKFLQMSDFSLRYEWMKYYVSLLLYSKYIFWDHNIARGCCCVPLQ